MKKKFRQLLVPFYARLRDLKPPGFLGADLFDVLRLLFKDIFSPRFTTMASSIAYNFFFSVIPMMILLFMLVPYLPIKGLEKEILTYAADYVPQGSMDLVKKLVKDAFRKMGAKLIALNVLAILLSSVRGIMALMRGFRRYEHEYQKRNIFKVYGKAFLLMTILFVFLILSTIILNVGDYLIDFGKKYIYIKGIDVFFLRILNYAITYTLLLLSITMTYIFGSDSRKRWEFFSPGSVVASVLLLLTMFLLNYYFSHIGSYNKIYGSLLAVVVLMLWFYYIGVVLLVGNALNHAIDRVLLKKEAMNKRKNMDVEKILPVKKENYYKSVNS